MPERSITVAINVVTSGTAVTQTIAPAIPGASHVVVAFHVETLSGTPGPTFASNATSITGALNGTSNPLILTGTQIEPLLWTAPGEALGVACPDSVGSVGGYVTFFTTSEWPPTAITHTPNEVTVSPNSADGSRDVSGLAEAVAYVRSRASLTNRYTIQLGPGTFDLSSVVNGTSMEGVTIVGAGMDATLIRRTRTLPYTTHGVATADPVLDLVASRGITLQDLSITHSGPYYDSALAFPIAIWTGAAKRFKMINCRIEGTYAGWYDKTDSVDATFSKPIPDNKIGDEDWSYVVRDSQVIGHRAGGLLQVARHEMFASGSQFLCDIPSGVTLAASVVPCGLNNWEYTQLHLKGCDVVLRSASTLTFTSTSAYAGGLVSQDSAVSDTAVHAEATRFMLDLKNGDVNVSTAVAAACVIGNATTNNTLRAKGCSFTYYTGTVTSARAIGGIFLWQQSNVTDSGTVLMDGGACLDMGGSGGTTRKDVVIGVSFPAALREPLAFQVLGNPRIASWAYSSSSGSPTPTHSQFMVTTNTPNLQIGSATLAAGTATVALPVGYPTQGTAVTDYKVFVTGNANETFYVNGKTASQFVINSSNAGSTATVDWIVRR